MARRSEPYRDEAPIVAEIAAGAVVVHAGTGEVLLLHERTEDRWSIPKGHVDPGESLRTAALREVAEETGLAHVTLAEELAEVNYRFFDPKKARNVHKTTVFFLGRTDERTVRTETIFDRADWCTLAEALRRVPFATDRAALEAARARLDRT